MLIEGKKLFQEALILAVDPLGAKHVQCKLPEGAQEASASAVGSVSLGDFFKVAKVRRKE